MVDYDMSYLYIVYIIYKEKKYIYIYILHRIITEKNYL